MTMDHHTNYEVAAQPRIADRIKFAASGELNEDHACKIHEAAEFIGVNPISILRLISRGVLKPCRTQRHMLIPVAQIEKVLNN